MFKLTWILGKQEQGISKKSQNFIELYPSVQSSPKNENFVNNGKNIPQN